MVDHLDHEHSRQKDLNETGVGRGRLPKAEEGKHETTWGFYKEFELCSECDRNH